MLQWWPMATAEREAKTRNKNACKKCLAEDMFCLEVGERARGAQSTQRRIHPLFLAPRTAV